MRRILAGLLAIAALGSSTLGRPVCCVVDVACCGEPAAAPDAPACPCCPREEPEPAPAPERTPSPHCACHDHETHVSLDRHAPVLAPPVASFAPPVALPDPAVALLAAPAGHHAPPLHEPALELPLLL